MQRRRCRRCCRICNSMIRPGKTRSQNRCETGTRKMIAWHRPKPIRLIHAGFFTTLNDKLPQNAIITADAGSTADWYGFHIKLGRNQMGNLSGRMASMLGAMPYAMAGKIAHPDRPVVCTIGDGAFQMLGMNGMLTVKRHWKEWDNPTFIVLVIDNGDLNQVSWEMRVTGDPRWDTAQLV